MSVKFLIAHTQGTLYNAGDVAGFDPEVEADLVKRGIAVVGGKKGAAQAPSDLKAKKVGEGWSVFQGRKELIKGLADENAAAAWIAEQALPLPQAEARQVGETWSVFAGADELVSGLADEAAAKAWIVDATKA